MIVVKLEVVLVDIFLFCWFRVKVGVVSLRLDRRVDLFRVGLFFCLFDFFCF